MSEGEHHPHRTHPPPDGRSQDRNEKARFVPGRKWITRSASHPSITTIAALTLVPCFLNDPAGRSIHSAAIASNRSCCRGTRFSLPALGGRMSASPTTCCDLRRDRVDWSRATAYFVPNHPYQNHDNGPKPAHCVFSFHLSTRPIPITLTTRRNSFATLSGISCSE